jgi:hypothetical protein
MSRLLSDSWLDNYVKYARSINTEPPREWQFWSAVAALSASLKRQVYFWYRGIQFFPNQYIVLVGPPGLGKGSAINPATDIAEAAGAANFFRDSVTAEKVIERLATGFLKVNVSTLLAPLKNDHCATAIALELPVFLSSTSDRKFSTLCALWDQNRFEYDTKNKGTSLIKDMSFGLVGGCTPNFIQHLSQNSVSAVTGGFSARTIFIYNSERDELMDSAFGAPTKINIQLYDALVNDLKHIASLRGEMRMDISAQKLWSHKYREHNKPDTKDDLNSDASANFKSRISSHIIKAAIAISVSESDNLTITTSHLTRAIELIERVRDRIDIVFRAVGESPLVVVQDKVFEFIKQQGITSRSAILKRLYRHMTDEQLTQVIYILRNAGLITELTEGNSFKYKSNI